MNPRHKAYAPLAFLIVLTIALAGGAALLLGAETPTGTVRGTLVAAESGALLSDTEVSLARDNEERAYRTHTDRRGRFTFASVAAGEYKLVASTEAHESPKNPITVAEGKTTEALFELKPVDPFLHVFESHRVFTTHEVPKIRVHGFVPAREMSVRAYRVRPDRAVSAWQGSLRQALGIRGEAADADLDRLQTVTSAASIPYPLQARDAEGLFREEVPLGKLGPGMYVVAFNALKVRALTVITVTDIGVIMKAASGQALVYVADIINGQPIPNAKVSVLRDETPIATGATGKDGIFRTALARTDREMDLRAVGRATSPAGESIAIARTWIFNERPEGNLRAYTYTDRPVYRPGQRVFYRSILRELRGERYLVPQREPATVRVTDPNDEIVHTEHVRATDLGSLSGRFDLNAEALPGIYTVRVLPDRGGAYEASFSVAEYRKPEYQVSVEPGQKRFTQGEDVTATVSARYFYGAPVPGASVRYYVTRSPYWVFEDQSAWDEDLSGEQDFEEEYGEGEIIDEGEGKTDDSGRLRITITPHEPQGSGERGYPFEENEGQDWRYTVHATVSDVSQRSESGTGAVLVTQGDFRLEVEAGEYLARPGQPVSVDVRAVDYDGKPVPDVSGRAEFSRREWKEGEENVTDASRQDWRAGGNGAGAFSVTPKRDGDWRIVVSARDSKGNTIRRAAYLWVMSGAYADFDYPYQSMQVRADKKLYREGEAAEIVVNTKFAPTPALLAVESSGIIEARLVQLTGKSTVLKVPITPAMMPSVKVHICFMHKKGYLEGEAVLNVSRERRALQVQVTSDKSTYLPGEAAVYTVKTLTPDGRPTPAEVSLGVVDAAVYAIQPDSTENIVSFFYPKRLDGVRTAFSFPEVYLSGDDKAGAGIRTRKFFPDTAFWNAATVTDAKGEATFHLTMPDSLTTWRATCRAASADTRVGQATYEAVCSKPFLVRLETPRFFTQGDDVEIAGVVHNLSGRVADASAGLDPGSLRVVDAGRDKARVDAGALERFAWTVRADTVGETKVRAWAEAGSLNDAMELPIPVLPKGRAHTDAVSADVVSAAAANFQVRQDAIPGTQRLTVRLSPSLVATMFGALDYLAAYPYGCAEQTMSAFLPDIVLVELLRTQGVRAPALERQLPDMVEAGLLKLQGFQKEDGGFGWWRYDETDPWMTVYVTYGLLRARSAGFTVPHGTLARALDRVRSLAVATTPLEPDTRAFAAYVMALSGNRAAVDAGIKNARDYPATRKTERGTEVITISDWGRSYLALAYARTGRIDEARRELAPVWSRVVNRKFIPDTSEDQWRSDAEYGAALLYAGCEINPNHPAMGDLVRWIVDQRRANHWSSTRDTAAVLYAMARYVALTKELRPDMTALVTVNGRTVANRHFTAADLLHPEPVYTVDARNLPPGPVNIAVKKLGTGRLYYTATLEQVAAEDLSLPVRNASGMTVERVYRRIDPGERDRENGEGPATRSTQTRFRTGDIIEVTLTVRSQAPFDYVMVEDPLPAGWEAQDRGAVSMWDWGYWWTNQIFRDEKAAFAIRKLDPGVRRISYRAIAQVPGKYTALPPRIYDMYNPATQGEGTALNVTVQ